MVYKQNKLIFCSIFLICLFFVAVVSMGCLKLDYTGSLIESSAKYELTKTDIFSLKEKWAGDEVSVLGVVLGDTQEDVIEKIGLPDSKTSYPNNIINFEYKESLTLKGTGLLFHFNNDKLTRITVKEPFDKFLIGQTKISANDKKSIVRIFRAPSKVQLLSFFTMYIYEDRNIEVFLEGKTVNGFSFILPDAQDEFDVAVKESADAKAEEDANADNADEESVSSEEKVE